MLTLEYWKDRALGDECIIEQLESTLLEVRQFINDAPLGDEAHEILGKIDASIGWIPPS